MTTLHVDLTVCRRACSLHSFSVTYYLHSLVVRYHVFELHDENNCINCCERIFLREVYVFVQRMHRHNLTVVNLKFFIFHRRTTIYSGIVVVESGGNIGVFHGNLHDNSYHKAAQKTEWTCFDRFK